MFNEQRSNVMSTFRATIKVKETITQGWDYYIDITYLYVYSSISVEDVRNKAKKQMEALNDVHMGDFSIPLSIVETELQFIEEIKPEIILRKYLT